MIKQSKRMLLSITEFRKKITQILDELDEPKILMNRDKPKAVLVPYQIYKDMEDALEDRMDELLVKVAENRVMESRAKHAAHDEFWDSFGED